MPEIEETELPGVGVLHAFMPRCGRRVGVITRRSGRRELIVYGEDDPDAVASGVVLSADESSALAELLGGSRVVERLAEVQQDIEGLAIDWLTLRSGSAAVGNTIGEIGVRAQTGTSIVAVLRDADAIPAPGPDFVLMPADAVVVVGTPDGISAAARLLGAA